MKLYNPFKPHIVEYDGWYYVRKLTIVGYKIQDRRDDYWWYVKEYWYHGRMSLEEAKVKRDASKRKYKYIP